MNKKKVKTYLDYLYSLDYKGKPVGISTFISNNEFVGNSTGGGKRIYPIWKKALSEMHSNDAKTQIVLTGAIGTGKTLIAILGLLYMQYRISHLKDPWGYFNLSYGNKMVISFFNLTKTLSSSKGYRLFQSYMLKSPWFRDNGIIRGSVNKHIELPLFEYVLASPYARGFGFLSEDLIGAVMDELDSPMESPNQKLRVLKAYEAAVRRFESRFVVDGCSLGKLFLVSSKQDEVSFLEVFVEKMKKSKHVMIFNVPFWEAKPASRYSGVKFPVMIGDIYNSPCIVEESEVNLTRKKGFEVIYVPVEHKELFEMDIMGALRDIAGISVRGIRKSKLLPSERLIVDCYDSSLKNPVSVSTIEIGLKDDVQLIQFVDMSALVATMGLSHCLAIDIAFSGDALGIATSAIIGYINVSIEKPDGTFIKRRVPVVVTDLIMRIKARSGDEIPIHKIREFILSLRDNKFVIKKVVADLKLASADTLQVLKRAGINAEYFSVDRTAKPYIDFKNLIIEKTWKSFRHPYAHFELKNLEYDRERGKIDHPKEVKDIEIFNSGEIKEIVLEGSKDLADSICSSAVNVVYDEGGTIDTEAMGGLMKKLTTGGESQGEKLWWVKDDKNKEVIGVEGDVNINKFKDMLKKVPRNK